MRRSLGSGSRWERCGERVRELLDLGREQAPRSVGELCDMRRIVDGDHPVARTVGVKPRAAHEREAQHAEHVDVTDAVALQGGSDAGDLSLERVELPGAVTAVDEQHLVALDAPGASELDRCPVSAVSSTPPGPFDPGGFVWIRLGFGLEQALGGVVCPGFERAAPSVERSC